MVHPIVCRQEIAVKVERQRRVSEILARRHEILAQIFQAQDSKIPTPMLSEHHIKVESIWDQRSFE